MHAKESNVSHTTIVVSSVALLLNVVQCQELDWQVTGSADGTDNMICNDCKVITCGCFSLNKRGVRQHRPFLFAICPGES